MQPLPGTLLSFSHSMFDVLVSCCTSFYCVIFLHLTEHAETAAETAVTASKRPPVVLSAEHADMNGMLKAMESRSQGCMHAWCRAAPAEEVYSFRQITQYAAFTPDTLSSIASALKAFGIWQVGDFVLLQPWRSLMHMGPVPW